MRRAGVSKQAELITRIPSDACALRGGGMRVKADECSKFR
jgi:hypothetical protein